MKEVLEWLDSNDENLLHDEELCEKARLLLLDTIVCIVSGSKSNEVQGLVQNISELNSGQVRFPNVSVKVGLLEAVYAATVAACWDEACEGLARAHGRPGLHAVPVAAILGAQRRLSLAQALRAIIWGYEVGGRAGEAMRMRSGFHVDGSWGSIGAAVAAAKVLGLDHPTTLTALNIASSQIPIGIFLPVIEGHTSRNSYAAQGTQQGIWAALLAKSGISAPKEAFMDSLAMKFQQQEKLPDEFLEPSSFYMLQGYLKPFAGARHLHYPATCAIQYRDHFDVPPPSEIISLRLYIYPEAIRYCGNRAPQTALQAQFSVSWATAYALLLGKLDPQAYRQDSLSDVAIRRLESIVEIHESKEFESRGCRLELTTRHGLESVVVGQIAGDPDLPLTRVEITAKAHAYMQDVFSNEKIDRIVAEILEGDLAGEISLPW